MTKNRFKTGLLAVAFAAVMSTAGFAGAGVTNAYAATNAAETEDSETVQDASGYKVKLEKTAYEYNATARKPKVTIVDSNGETLEKGKDYTCSYENNVYPGRATVKISYKGKYRGSKKVGYTIKQTSVKWVKSTHTASEITLKWSAFKTATKYEVLKQVGNSWQSVYDGTSAKASFSGLSANKRYKYTINVYGTNPSGESVKIAKKIVAVYTNPAKMTGTSGGVTESKNSNVVISSSDKAVALLWNRVNGVTGYFIYRYNAKQKTWKKVATIGANDISYEGAKGRCDIDGLKQATGYMFKVSAYTKRKGVIYEGEKSDVIKTATTPDTSTKCASGVTPGGCPYYTKDNVYTKKRVSKASMHVYMDFGKNVTGCYIYFTGYNEKGKVIREKTYKTTKKHVSEHFAWKGDSYTYNIQVRPYFKYGDKIYVSSDDCENSDGLDVVHNYKGGVKEYRISKYAETGMVTSSTTYNAKGQMTEKIVYGKKATYYYNSKNKLVKYETGEWPVTYTYNASKKLIEKYVYDTKTQEATWYNAKGKIIRYSRAVYDSTGKYIGGNEYSASGKLLAYTRIDTNDKGDWVERREYNGKGKLLERYIY